MINHLLKLSYAFLTVSLLVLQSGSAQACGFGYCWGGVGFGPDGISGYSQRQNTVPDAEAQVRTACGDKCTTIEVFNDTCAALASGPDGASFLGFGATRGEAFQAVKQQCETLEQPCVVRVEACSLKN